MHIHTHFVIVLICQLRMCAYKAIYENQIYGEKWAPSGGLLCLGAARAAAFEIWKALCSDIDES